MGTKPKGKGADLVSACGEGDNRTHLRSKREGKTNEAQKFAVRIYRRSGEKEKVS